jgi:glutathione synthase/RimK-type ligase-like ATP-grasp enzyme
MDVVLATSAALPGLSADDRLLLDVLVRAGVETEPAVWEDPHYDWASARLCVIRSTWDYAYRLDQFVSWARKVGSRTTLLNPAHVVEWNTHKCYLLDLEQRGVPVVPTEVLQSGSASRLAEVLDRRGWREVIVKAAVAQTGLYLKHFKAASLDAGQAHLDRLLPHEDMLVQPYLPAVSSSGEVSLVYVDGALTHAVRKLSADGDVRVHHEFGGTVVRDAPSEEECAVAAQTFDAVNESLLYGRVDLVADETGRPVVMELELVEPDLFFRVAPDSAERLAGSILGRLEKGEEGEPGE